MISRFLGRAWGHSYFWGARSSILIEQKTRPKKIEIQAALETLCPSIFGTMLKSIWIQAGANTSPETELTPKQLKT